MDVLHPILPQQILPIPCAGDLGRGLIRKQGFRMGIEGDGSGFAAQLRCQSMACLQQRLMSDVDTVKKAQRVNSFLVFHSVTG